MSITKSLSATALAAAILAAVPLVEAVSAQPAPGAAAQEADQKHRARPSRIEGRLAFLKTELEITDAQSAPWGAFADVLRLQDKARRERFEQMRAGSGQAASAVERLERRERASEARAQELKQFVAAFRPLYAALSEEQKKTADDLFGREHGPGHHGMRRH
jgi:hypothetical protein